MAFLGLFVFGVFVIALLYNGGAAIENKINEHKCIFRSIPISHFGIIRSPISV